jgi:Siroheme synthase (precorrin-2 oxidase/ferrochelatase domain)
MIPLMLDLTGRRVLIFGGGGVGARKAAHFEHEAEVTVISRSFSPRFDGLSVRRHETDLASLPDDAIVELLDGAFLAVAATPDPALNNRIGRLCASAGVLFNNAAGNPATSSSPRSSGDATTSSLSAPAERALPYHVTSG